MYTDQERINRLEHLLRVQQKNNRQMKEVLLRIVGSLAVELGTATAKTLLSEIQKLSEGTE